MSVGRPRAALAVEGDALSAWRGESGEEPGGPVVDRVGAEDGLPFVTLVESGEQPQRRRQVRPGEHEGHLPAEEATGRRAVLVDGEPGQFGGVGPVRGPAAERLNRPAPVGTAP